MQHGTVLLSLPHHTRHLLCDALQRAHRHNIYQLYPLFSCIGSAFTCVFVVSWITAFLKFSFESVLPIAITNRAAAAEDPC